ncbi:hypothetical protein DUI87_27451 [Hirundo rustica rustica]|uniref:Uncharacterized protein n=1 Tax=Hirundo rustica rustica TaxID=333673 RepID=A0A3M0J5D3_HIRRU|nr:hypothetical protein DUI87_27451 [Hirundo rustica rustica]
MAGRCLGPGVSSSGVPSILLLDLGMMKKEGHITPKLALNIGPGGDNLEEKISGGTLSSWTLNSPRDAAALRNHILLYKLELAKKGSTSAGTSVLSPFPHIGSVIALAAMIYKKSAVELFERHLCLYILTFGFVSAKITNQLVAAHMAKSEILIHPVIQGMQMTAMPIDPELAAKGKPNSLMILKARPTHTQKKGAKEMLTEHKETTLAQEMSTKFEKECEKLDAAREMLEKLEAEMRECENLDYWEYRRN